MLRLTRHRMLALFFLRAALATTGPTPPCSDQGPAVYTTGHMQHPQRILFPALTHFLCAPWRRTRLEAHSHSTQQDLCHVSKKKRWGKTDGDSVLENDWRSWSGWDGFQSFVSAMSQSNSRNTTALLALKHTVSAYPEFPLSPHDLYVCVCEWQPLLP